jgi:hypothetical protein
MIHTTPTAALQLARLLEVLEGPVLVRFGSWAMCRGQGRHFPLGT